MNYPIWSVPGAGLLIAGIAVLHVFISHFAVGGGLFLVWLERRARRTGDPALLAYARRHTRFFVLVTLVLGAVTGVGIWFTIALVHPQATSTLIQAFVWGWAIEWTFFATEIAAALVYYYGWDRLEPRTHLAVGWVYFGAAWLSLAVINGILSFMLTPGHWIVSQSFWEGILNPTYLPTLVARTVGAIGLAGAYGLLTLAWSGDRALQARLVRPLALGWVLPGAALLLVSLLWVLSAASGAGIPVAASLGAPGEGLRAILGTLYAGSTTGHPIGRAAARIALDGVLVAAIVALLLAAFRAPRVSRAAAVLVMAGALAAVGGFEWTREVLRKPYIIGNYMLVSGVRVTGPPPFTVDDLRERGALRATAWSAGVPHGSDDVDRLDQAGLEVFRLQCSQCHTRDGYQAIRPLVQGSAPGTLERVIDRLPEWRGRRMPPFAGSPSERLALAVHLSLLGGAPRAAIAGSIARDRAVAESAAQVFEDNCGMCHGAQGEFPIEARGRPASAFYDLLARLPEINDAMPPYDGSEEERQALAAYLAMLGNGASGGAR